MLMMEISQIFEIHIYLPRYIKTSSLTITKIQAILSILGKLLM